MTVTDIMSYRKTVAGVVLLCALTGTLLMYRDEARRTVSVWVSPDAPQENFHKNQSSYKKILLWNDFFGRKDYYFGTGQKLFSKMGCKVQTCFVTYDRSMFPLSDIDALVWHARSKDFSLPSIRSSHTRYVFFVEETPVNQLYDFRLYKDTFNYTMTYRHDSDIFAPYGELDRVQNPKPLPSTNIAAKKTKMAAWFVSNCNTQSSRDVLALALQQHISVDVYGKCGPLKCAPDSKHCNEMLNEDYRFYLAFENSLCQDYVTEKLFAIISLDVIPVVYGWAPYKDIVPPHSYIDVRDFKTVKHLADYLLYLAGNNTAYNEYFRWKGQYRRAYSQNWCRLCEKLHTDTQHKTYDIFSWFEQDKCTDQATLLGSQYFT